MEQSWAESTDEDGSQVRAIKGERLFCFLSICYRQDLFQNKLWLPEQREGLSGLNDGHKRAVLSLLEEM